MRRLLPAGLLLFLLPVSPVHTQESAPLVMVQYSVNARGAKEGRVPIEMTIRNAPAGDVTVAIPVWRPGSYRLQNYPDRVKDVTAAAGDKDLAVEAVDKKTWKVKWAGGDLTIRYSLAPDPAELDSDHYFVEGPGTYFYVDGHKDVASSVRFSLPDGWKIGTGLKDAGDGAFGARDYDTFVDCPTELGKFELHSFAHGGVAYEIVVHAAGPWDSEGLIEAIKKIVRYQCGMFGGAPFDRYVFIYHFRNVPGGGGLEHLNSTNIALPYESVRQNGQTAAGITSHEFFHMMNVKRIRPKELGPFDYTQPVRSKALWFCEGVTSYYGDLTLKRAGVWNEDRYLSAMEDQIVALQGNPLHKTVSVEESSRTVWDRKRGDPSLDYYNKGDLLGWLLDLKIRVLTKNGKSFDDVMNLMYRKYVVDPSNNGGGPIGVGFPEDGILKAVNEVTGGDFSDFFSRYVSGVEELPYEEVLEAAGLSVERSVRRSVEFASPLWGPIFDSVPPGSDDEKAGLQAGDRVLEMAGRKIRRETFDRELKKLKAGEPVEFRILRDGRELELKLTPVAKERHAASVTRSLDASAEQREMIDSWLSSRP